MMELRTCEVENASRQPNLLRENSNAPCVEGYSIEEDEWRPSKDIKGVKRLVSEFSPANPEHPNISQPLNFSKLPFCPLTNFTDTPDTVPQIGLVSRCVSGHCTFEWG